MEPLTIFGTIFSAILLLNKNFLLLIMIFLFYIFVQEVWRGLYKTLTILMFPGAIIHIAIHYMVAKFYGSRVMPFFRMGILEETPHTAARISSIREVYTTILLQMVAPTTIAYLFFNIADLTNQIIAKAIFVWFGVSVFVAGLPKTSDIQMLIAAISAADPMVLIFLIWSIPLFAIGLIGFGAEIAFMGTIIYLSTIIMLTVLLEPKNYERGLIEETVVDEE